MNVQCPRCRSAHAQLVLLNPTALATQLECSCCGLVEYPDDSLRLESTETPAPAPVLAGQAYPRSHVRVLDVEGLHGPVKVVLA